MSARPATGPEAAGMDPASSLQAVELVRHPGHAARAEARWSDLRAATERLHTVVRPRFVSTALLLGGLMAVLAAGLSWLAS